MTDGKSLYTELKPDIEAVVSPLFDFSELCLKERGNFLPHAAVLTAGGEIKLVGAAPDTSKDRTNSTDVLPFHKKLFKGCIFGSVFSVSANPEVKAWHAKAP